MNQQPPVRKHAVGDLVWWIPRERATDNRIKCGKIESIEIRLTGESIPGAISMAREPDYVILGASFIEDELYSDPRLAWKELLRQKGVAEKEK